MHSSIQEFFRDEHFPKSLDGWCTAVEVGDYAKLQAQFRNEVEQKARWVGVVYTCTFQNYIYIYMYIYIYVQYVYIYIDICRYHTIVQG